MGLTSTSRQTRQPQNNFQCIKVNEKLPVASFRCHCKHFTDKVLLYSGDIEFILKMIVSKCNKLGLLANECAVSLITDGFFILSVVKI